MTGVEKSHQYRYIANPEQLIEDDESPKRVLLDIFDETIEALQPSSLLEQELEIKSGVLRVHNQRYVLADFENIHVITSGKGSLALAKAIDSFVPITISDILVVEKRDQGGEIADGEVLESDHPIPSKASVNAGEAVVSRAEEVGPNDLVIAGITGGTSALVTSPPADVDISEIASITDGMLNAGAPIEEVNTVRKRVSTIKGGQLAEILYPSTVISLILVDEVAGEPWGPTVTDMPPSRDAIGILKKYGLWSDAPEAVKGHLRGTMCGRNQERNQPSTPPATNVQNVVLADGSDACEAAANRIRERGLSPHIVSTTIEGESATVARVMADIGTEIHEKSRPLPPPCILISGGETTVTVGDAGGIGGPNQEFALAAASKIEGRSEIVVAAIDTDGTDGPTEAAGGIVDSNSVSRAENLGLDISEELENHNALPTLDAIGGLVEMNPTNTNLMDLRLIYIG